MEQTSTLSVLRYVVSIPSCLYYNSMATSLAKVSRYHVTSSSTHRCLLVQLCWLELLATSVLSACRYTQARLRLLSIYMYVGDKILFHLQTSRSALEEAVHGEHTEIVTMLIKAKSKADDRVG